MKYPGSFPIYVIALTIVATVALALRIGAEKMKPESAEKPADVSAQTRTPEILLATLPAVEGTSVTDLALIEAREKARRKPADANVWSQLGDAIAQKQRDTSATLWYAHAEAAYQKALELQPQLVDALNGLAWVYGGRHDFQASVKWAKQALEAQPQNPVALGIIGDAALELGDLDRAFESYQQMMDARPDLSSYSRGAYIVWLTGDSKKGRWLMQKAIQAGSPHAENTAWCRARLTMMLFHEGALLPAAQVAEQGVKATPDHVPLLLMLGRIKVAQQDDKTAIATFEKVLAQGPNHDALTALGDLHAARGHQDTAEMFYQQVEALHAANLKSGTHDHTQMARFYADHDRQVGEALRLASEHASSQNVFELDVRAWAAFKSGDLPQARKSIQTALNIGTQDAEIIYHAGIIAAATGDRPGAQKLLSRALSLNPHFHPLHAPLATRKLDELAVGLATTK